MSTSTRHRQDTRTRPGRPRGPQVSNPFPADVSREWARVLDAWAATMRAGGRPETTIRTRLYYLGRWALEQPHPAASTTDGLVEWMGRQQWSRNTRRSAVASLRLFFRWARFSGRIEHDPGEHLPTVSLPTPNPHPAPEDVIRAALTAGDDRMRLMLRLACELGLRRGEVARVHRDHLYADLAGWSIVVHGKGSRTRVLPVPDDLAAEILAACAGGYAFPGREDGHLSAQWVGKIVGRALPAGVTMHSLRHRFATAAYAVDTDLLVVQSLLGHASPETTRGYVRLPGDALRRTVLAAGLPPTGPALAAVKPTFTEPHGAGLENPCTAMDSDCSTPAPSPRLSLFIAGTDTTRRPDEHSPATVGARL
jgi:integrase/recombinase XerC